MTILVVGAGASALCFAYKLQRSFQNFTLRLYEKNLEISGTWYENRYPGCACDVPSHNYVYSWEPKYDWSAVYAGSAEIKEYFKWFAAKHDLNKYVTVNREVCNARWHDDKAQWEVCIRDVNTGQVNTEFCDLFINASGILNWKWPEIEGLKDFKETLLHSANYDESADLTGQRVGLIGNG